MTEFVLWLCIFAIYAGIIGAFFWYSSILNLGLDELRKFDQLKEPSE